MPDRAGDVGCFVPTLTAADHTGHQDRELVDRFVTPILDEFMERFRKSFRIEIQYTAVVPPRVQDIAVLVKKLTASVGCAPIDNDETCVLCHTRRHGCNFYGVTRSRFKRVDVGR